jgi:acyl dehydratase
VIYDDVEIGAALPTVVYPLTVYRLVMAAGSNRDFNSIHHNSEYARQTGAPEMYANTSFLLSSGERCVRDWMGPGGAIRGIRNFRMRSFNLVGDTMRVLAEVSGKRVEDGVGVVEIAIRCENSNGVTVGPGTVEVTLPRRTGSEGMSERGAAASGPQRSGGKTAPRELAIGGTA